MLSALKDVVLEKLRERGVVVRRTFEDRDRARYRAAYSDDSLQGRRFYNVGAGLFSHPYWTNIDFPSAHYGAVQAKQAFIPHDLMSLQPLAIESDTAEVLYTSHTIEHVKDAAVAKLFSEAYRVLKPGGFFRVTTGPDADSDYAALQRHDAAWFYWDEDISLSGWQRDYVQPPITVSLKQRWLFDFASAASRNCRHPAKQKFSDDEIDEVFRASSSFEAALDTFADAVDFQADHPGLHVSWWTHDKTIRMLRDASFENVYRSGHGQSCCPILRNTWYFDNTHPQVSLYVEAVK
jgi:SAM-dependent methyltransferase